MAVFALTILILGFSFLKGNNLFSKERIFYARYDNVANLSRGDNVLFKGLRVGKVTETTFEPDGNYTIVVGFSVQKDITVPDDSRARIVTADLLGEKALEIVLGNSSTMASNGSFLRGTVEQSLSQQIEEQLQPVRQRIEALVVTVDSVISRFNAIFDVNFAGKVDENIISIQAAIQNIRSITENVDLIISMQVTRIDSVMLNIRDITATIRDNREALGAAIQNFAAVGDSIKQADIVGTFKKLNLVLEDLEQVADKANEGDGTVARLLSDPKMYENMEALTRNLEVLLDDIRKNPGRYAPALIRVGAR